MMSISGMEIFSYLLILLVLFVILFYSINKATKNLNRLKIFGWYCFGSAINFFAIIVVSIVMTSLVLFELGNENLENKNYRTASRYFSKSLRCASLLENFLIAGGPSRYTLFYDSIGVACYKNFEFKEAVENFKKSLVLDEDQFFAHVYLARSYLHDKNFEMAKAEFQIVTTLDPVDKDLFYYYQLGYAFHILGDTSRALKEYEMALKFEPDNELVLSLIEEIENKGGNEPTSYIQGTSGGGAKDGRTGGGTGGEEGSYHEGK